VGRVYTRRGDKGKTSTFLGKMSKADQLVEALGSLDELNSWIGVCRTYSSSPSASSGAFPPKLGGKKKGSIDSELKKMQTNLMTIATVIAGHPTLKLRNGKEVKHLEDLIDKLEKDLPKLKNFIYPVGYFQVARAVCRRCEREIVRFVNNAPSAPPLSLRGGRGSYVLQYLNRLSDALFVMGRWVTKKQGIKEEKR
jgi:cob(I)alamin adenosyltransferase